MFFSLIHYFEADFPQKVSLKILNEASSASDIFVYSLFKDNWQFKLICKYFVGILQVLRFKFL